MGTVNQIDLIAAITRHLDRRGHEGANARQVNAIIAAADLIVDAFGKPHEAARPGSGLEAWLRSDDTGASSLAMARHLAPLAGINAFVQLGRHAHGGEHPADPEDFGRCMRLLEAVPELKGHMASMASVSTTWARLAGCWEELEALYREESPTGKAPRLYRRMRDLIEGRP